MQSRRTSSYDPARKAFSTNSRARSSWPAFLRACFTRPMIEKTLPSVPTSLQAGLGAFVESGAILGGDLGEVVEASRRKIQGQISRLAEMVDRRARQRLYRQAPELRNLPEFVRPRRGLQERGLSGVSFPQLFGAAVTEALLEAADVHLHHLASGERRHLVLEASRG